MQDAGNLRLAPTLLDVQLADDVGPALAAERDRAGPGPANCVPPPEKPFPPGLCAAMDAEKPPPNEAV